MPHHVSPFHHPMPMSHRAAQFAPFAALSGHDEAISETIRTTDSFKELTENEKIIISGKLKYALEKHSDVVITYFIADKSKEGGYYKKIRGKIKKWCEFDNTIVFIDGLSIRIDLIYDISIKEYDDFN